MPENPNRPGHRAKALRFQARSVDRTVRIVSKWPEPEGHDLQAIVRDLEKAKSLLSSVADRLLQMPEDWPKQRGPNILGLKPGSRISIHEIYHYKYDAMLPAEDLSDAEVLRVGKNHVDVRTKSGIETSVLRRHIRMVQP